MRFSFESRCRIVQLILEGESPAAAAGASGASRATGYRLWRRYRDGGWEALRDRPSTPKRQPRRLSVECEAKIAELGQRTQAGPLVLAAILERPASTVGKVLRRLGLSRLPKPEREPVVRYERERPGDRGMRAMRAADTPASRSPPRRRRQDMRSIPYSRAGLVPRPRHPGRARAHRQRRRLPLPPLAHRLRPQPATPTLHPPLPATNQRQSRSPDQNTHPRVGLPLRLPNQHTPRQSPPQLPPLVQPTTSTQLPRRPTTNQPRLRPLWSVQLGPILCHGPQVYSRVDGSTEAENLQVAPRQAPGADASHQRADDRGMRAMRAADTPASRLPKLRHVPRSRGPATRTPTPLGSADASPRCRRRDGRRPRARRDR